MTAEGRLARLDGRSVIAVAGDDWRSYLQGLITQDVIGLSRAELRYGALLTPQGRLLFDLFILGTAEGCLIDCAADRRTALIERFKLYRLRAKVEIEPRDLEVRAVWGITDAPAGWLPDPRRPELGFRGYGPTPIAGATTTTESDYANWCLRLGVPSPSDFAGEQTYPIEANFDLLAGIDFRKGCFVGQETTSRMKRRGAIKNRMAPIIFDGPPPPHGSEVLAGETRAGEALSGQNGLAMALLRLDRIAREPRILADGRPWAPHLPPWLEASL